MGRAFLGIVMAAAVAGCSDSEPRYEISQGSIAAYMNPGQSQPTTVLLDRQTAQTWYLIRDATGGVTWLPLGKPDIMLK
ncbi:hypothetical protein NKJ59_03625 [Mesorhizobium australicum]|uniref:hypothetical protein n=1 Tax=Mesorhizobium australicum TaxID=536018 RepID=UPI0033350643